MEHGGGGGRAGDRWVAAAVLQGLAAAAVVRRAAGSASGLARLRTFPVAAGGERLARADLAARGGLRSMRLGDPAHAAPKLEAAHAVLPTDGNVTAALTRAHLELAEAAVAGGLDADAY